MNTTSHRRRSFALFALGAFAVHRLLVRKRWSRWSATPTEVGRYLPGDGLVDLPHTVTTRALTIDAPARDIWPWLVQLGDGRGGLYSYDWLDQLFGFLSRPSADAILPEHQHLEVGDVIPLGRGPSWPVVQVQPERHLVLEPVPGGVSWCFFLDPIGGARTRLISRVRVRVGSRALLFATSPFVDAVWFGMERRMLLGIEARAERSVRHAPPAVSLRPVR